MLFIPPLESDKKSYYLSSPMVPNHVRIADCPPNGKVRIGQRLDDRAAENSRRACHDHELKVHGFLLFFNLAYIVTA